MHIAIIEERDPDSACTLRLFIDGRERTDFDLYQVDPGRGYTREEWTELRRTYLQDAAPRTALQAALAATLDSCEESPHIGG